MLRPGIHTGSLSAQQGQSLRYWFRSFFVRTLSFTIGRLAVEEMRVLLRRRRRSQRASSEKKWRTIQAPPITAMTPRIASPMRLSKFSDVYLAHAARM